VFESHLHSFYEGFLFIVLFFIVVHLLTLVYGSLIFDGFDEKTKSQVLKSEMYFGNYLQILILQIDDK